MITGRRRVVAKTAASVAAVFWGFFWFGLIDLLVVVEQDAQFNQSYMLESGWGLLYLVLVTAPLVLLVMRPGDPVALTQLAVVTLVVLIGAVWRGTWPQLWNGIGLAITVGLLAWLGRGRLVSWRRPDPLLSALALVGLPAAVVTAVEDITNGVSHYPMQASLALAVVGLVALAAVTGSRLPAWTAAFSACWLGIESIVYPDLAGSLEATGGVLTTVWAALVVVAMELTRRRTSHSRPATPDRVQE
jgi:hypothetical protein